MNSICAFVAGLVFGLGLIVSGMSNPAKVLAFLDVAGQWDPSLMLVMAGAIGVGAVAFAIAKRRTQSWLGLPLSLPAANHVDRRLVIGSALFGVGWGLAGICPGPALVLIGMATTKGMLFLVAMLAGMAAFEGLERLSRGPRAAAS